MRIPIVSGLLALSIAIFSCHSSHSVLPGENGGYDTQKLIGGYEGKFGSGLITVVFNYVNGNIVSGYEIHKGIRRNLNGTLVQDGNNISLELKEPGTYVMDGKFSLKMDTSASYITGNWKAFKAGQSPEKALDLKRHERDSTETSYDEYTDWRGEIGTDTTLEFAGDGYCEFQFYPKAAQDSNVQAIVVKGSYVRSGKTFRIEWQRNNYTPAQQMTLKIKKEPYDRGEAGDSVIYLEGHGWKLNPIID